MTIRVPEYTARVGIQALNVQYDTSRKQAIVRWQNPPVSDAFTVIYRADGGGEFRTLNALPKGATQYADLTVKAGMTYEYTARVFYPDGKSSAFSAVSTLSF